MKTKLTFILFLIFWFVNAAYYHPNPDIDSYLNDVTENFVKITSYANTNPNNIPTSLFSSLANDFSILKDKLPQTNPNFKVIYENCYLASSNLAKGFSRIKFDTFNAQCFWPWKQLTRELESRYSVKAKIKAFPHSGNAPLTVTFDWRGSVDPSADTIPTNNYFWYYKNSQWKEVFIWQWPVIKYTFNTPNTYKVHLTVRSANKSSQWILDGEATTTIMVAPPIAKIVLYINWQKASTYSYVKLSSEEWKQWVLFDASWTTPQWGTKIVSSTWIIRHNNKIIYQNTIPDYPGSVRVKLPENGFYFVTLKVKDNTGKSVTKTYKVIVSNPVALIKITPTWWNTSTTFFIDGSASYSVKWKITSYKWTIVGPDWNIIDTFDWKKSFKYKFIVPGHYSIKLEVTDIEGNKNDASYKLYVDSTPPVASFIYSPYDNWEKPSTFIFDASYSYDVDEKIGDKLSYIWNFSDSKYVKTQSINNWQKLIAQFSKIWVYKVTLTVKDKYGKSSSITKEIKVLSTLRPKVEINPNYTILWEPVQIKVETNKPVAYYEYYFWDWKVVKTQSSLISHTYSKAGVYRLAVKVYSIDGDSNTVYSNVFIGQRWYPLAIYKVKSKWKILIPTTYCKVDCEGTGCKFTPAYKIPRLQDVTIDATDSINSQWEKNLLKIYFEKSDSKQYIIQSVLTTKFDELGCKKITLYVKDLNNSKIDKKDIYFKVVDALPVLKDLKMYFPQYGWDQNWVFRPNIGGANTLPKNIFSPGFDPLLVKLQAVNAYDPDSPMLSYFRWYYYKKWDKSNLIDVKITPYNIPEVVFAVPRIPGQYIFWVDVCDVDGKCTNSEQYLHLKPMVDIPPSNSNPDIPQVNSVRIDYNWVKWVGEVNVGDKVTIHVDASILSQKPDFYTSRTIKYDFDNDGKWDLTTKKDVVEHVYTKPWKYRVKVKVIYRGYGGIGYSAPLIVKKWLKPYVDLNYKWQNLIFADLSMGDIKEKELCFDIFNCKKSPKNYLFTIEDYGHVYYPTTGRKLLIFKFKDAYGNEKTIRRKIFIKPDPKNSYLLTLPKVSKTDTWYNLVVSWMYKNWFVIYYKSKNKDCYIDKNISVDTNWDKNTANDKDLMCNEVYKLTYSDPQVVLIIHDWNETKKLMVQFPYNEDLIPAKYKTQYAQIKQLIYKYAWSKDDKINYLVKMLSDLSENLDDTTNRDAILYQLNTFINTNKGLIASEDEKKIESIISTLSDVATNAALDKNDWVLGQAKSEILLLLSSLSEEKLSKVKTLFQQLDQTSSKSDRKKILQQILDIAVEAKKSGDIDDWSLQMIKSDICSLLKYYEIPSKLCWTELKQNVPVESSSPISKVVKAVLIVLAAVVLIFIILVIIFVIKAKKRRAQNQ